MIRYSFVVTTPKADRDLTTTQTIALKMRYEIIEIGVCEFDFISKNENVGPCLLLDPDPEKCRMLSGMCHNNWKIVNIKSPESEFDLELLMLDHSVDSVVIFKVDLGKRDKDIVREYLELIERHPEWKAETILIENLYCESFETIRDIKLLLKKAGYRLALDAENFKTVATLEI